MSDKEKKLSEQAFKCKNAYSRVLAFMNEESSSEFSSENYSDAKLLAKGGIKEIYKVRDLKAGRYVAMAKLIEEYHSPKNNERFLREARILASLEHTNIVPIYEIGDENEDSFYYTMKLLSGETLDSILKKQKDGDEEYIKKYPIRKLLGIFIRICDAISFAHSNNIVHLDLKPVNIQISSYGEVSVIDWGMAKPISGELGPTYKHDNPKFTPMCATVSFSENISGTPGFMSPEQARGDAEDINIGSDIYALGATLYSIIYKHNPYSGEPVENMLHKAQKGILPEFNENINGDKVPSTLQAITKKAMMADSIDRYEDVESMQRDITLYLNDFATQAENINLIKFSRLFIRRHKRALMVALLFTISLGTILSVSYYEIKQKEKILQTQNIRENATADEVITGTLKKHENLRQTRQYDTILKNYQELRKVGYSYPEFIFDEAKIHAGYFNYQKALNLLNQIPKEDSIINRLFEFRKLYNFLNIAVGIQKERRLTFDELVTTILNTDTPTQLQTMWKLNTDSTTSIEKKMDWVKRLIPIYNSGIKSDSFNFNYSNDKGYLKLDLSGTDNLYFGHPLYGLDLDELDISNTTLHLSVLKDFIKEQLSVFKLSGNNSHFSNDYAGGAKFHTLIAKRTMFAAERLNEIPNLKHLDIEGAELRSRGLTGSRTLEHLNIAFSDINSFNFLTECPALKILIIDKDQEISSEIKSKLKKQETNVIIKNEETLTATINSNKPSDILTLPDIIQAEDYSSMRGISMNTAIDDDGGRFVGWWESGDFLTFDVNVSQAGKYKTTFRLAGTNFDFELHDNRNLLLKIEEQGTQGWQDWKSISRIIDLPKGKNKLTIKCTGQGWNINWINFELL